MVVGAGKVGVGAGIGESVKGERHNYRKLVRKAQMTKVSVTRVSVKNANGKGVRALAKTARGSVERQDDKVGNGKDVSKIRKQQKRE